MFAYLAAALGVCYAAVSAYWALGGTGLLDTIGGSLEQTARKGLAVAVTLWAVVLIKLIAVAPPLITTRPRERVRHQRVMVRLTMFEAGILTVYGLVLTIIGVLVQAGVIHRSAHADQRALKWHAFLWDPWFLVWGLAVGAAVFLLRTTRPGSCRVRTAT